MTVMSSTSVGCIGLWKIFHSSHVCPWPPQQPREGHPLRMLLTDPAFPPSPPRTADRPLRDTAFSTLFCTKHCLVSTLFFHVCTMFVGLMIVLLNTSTCIYPSPSSPRVVSPQSLCWSLRPRLHVYQFPAGTGQWARVRKWEREVGGAGCLLIHIPSWLTAARLLLPNLYIPVISPSPGLIMPVVVTAPHPCPPQTLPQPCLLSRNFYNRSFTWLALWRIVWLE